MHYYPLAVLSMSWILWGWEIYLEYRQYKVYKTTKSVPKELSDQIDLNTFKKSKAYSMDKAKFGFISSLFSQIQSTITIYFFFIPFFWRLSSDIMFTHLGMNRSDTVQWEIFQSIIFSFIVSLVSTLINLPFSIYNTFVIEERHGFNKQTARFYAWDKFKSFLVSYLISSPIVAAAVYIVRNGGPYFFLYLWMFCFVVICVLTFFHGEIAALFDKFTPLPEGNLRKEIERLANSVNFPLKMIFVVEGSKRSSHSNAYLGGFLNRKRIVIYDTLIEGYYDKKDKKEIAKSDDKTTKSDQPKRGCNHEEILAILCHEIGHWHHGHMIKNLMFSQMNLFLVFLLFSRFYRDPVLYTAFGFVDMPVVIGLMLFTMILTPYNEVIGFVSTIMSRSFEYQADSYSKRKGYSEKLKTALIKLNIDNLSFPIHDHLYSKFNHSHPTLIQRLKALDKVD